MAMITHHLPVRSTVTNASCPIINRFARITFQLTLSHRHQLKRYPSSQYVQKRAMVRSFYIQSTVCGHHVYKEVHVWSPCVGEELSVQCESGNDHDPSAVAGHHCRSLTTGNIQSLLVFLQKNSPVDSNRRRLEVEEKELLVLYVYIFNGKHKHLDRHISVFTKL